MVYCGGLENRCGPQTHRGFESLPLRHFAVQEIVKSFYVQLVLWSLGILAIFGVAWYLGWLKSLSVYIGETRDELKKCNWPSKDELWNSTVLVFIVLAALGLFTIGVDFGILQVVRRLL